MHEPPHMLLAARLCLQGHLSTDTNMGRSQHGRTDLIPSYKSSSSCLETIIGFWSMLTRLMSASPILVQHWLAED